MNLPFGCIDSKMSYYPWQHSFWQRLQAYRTHLPQALLIHGQAGIGKNHLIWLWGQSLLCQHLTADWLPCGTCQTCRWFKKTEHPDVQILAPEENTMRQISIDRIRELNHFLSLTAYQQQGMRLIVIQEADRLNQAAANALLKLLEEPPVRTLFILITAHFHALLPTIKSRCQHFAMGLPDKIAAIQWLKEKGLGGHAESLLHQAGGAPLLAFQYHDESYQALRHQLAQHWLQPKTWNYFSLAEQFKKDQLLQILTLLQQWVMDLITLKLTDFKYTSFFQEYRQEQTQLLKKHQALTEFDCFSFYKTIQQELKLVHHTIQVRLQLEVLFGRYVALFQ